SIFVNSAYRPQRGEDVFVSFRALSKKEEAMPRKHVGSRLRVEQLEAVLAPNNLFGGGGDRPWAAGLVALAGIPRFRSTCLGKPRPSCRTGHRPGAPSGRDVGTCHVVSARSRARSHLFHRLGLQ